MSSKLLGVNISTTNRSLFKVYLISAQEKENSELQDKKKLMSRNKLYRTKTSASSLSRLWDLEWLFYSEQTKKAPECF